MTAQLLVCEGDATAATALFACDAIEVRSAVGLNGELRDRHVVLLGDLEFCESFAAEIHGYAASVATCVLEGELPTDRAEAFKWAKATKKQYHPDAAPGTSEPVTARAATPNSSAVVKSSVAALPVLTSSDNSARASIPSVEAQEPVGASETHASGDWTQDVPPEPATVLKRPMPRKRPKLGLVESDGNLALAHEPDPDPLPASLSEDALSAHFIENYGENWRFVPEWNVWLHWKGDGWYRDTRHEVGSIMMRVTRDALQWREAQTLTPDGRRKINSKRSAWNSRDIAATDPRIAILAEELDADPMILGVPGGVVDLRNGKLLDAEPEQYVTRRCSVAPQDGEHPLFDRVLARACAEHDGMREYLLRWFGYMLTGDVREESFVFLYGPGGSGKSTLIKCLTDIMCDYAVSISMDALLESKNPRHTQEIAKLAGMRLIYASETAEGRMWNEALVKDMTGRDKVTARFMRGNDFTFQPVGKLLLYGNAMPHLKSVGEEMRRRIHLIEYAGSLSSEERDSSLKDRLVSEYPAILATLIRGCVDWQDCGGLGKPDSVEASVENYLESEDSLALFLDECVERDPKASALSGEIYRRYRNWAGGAGEYVMSQKRFVQTLRVRGFEPKKASGGVRQITGLRLRAQQQDYPPPHQSERD